MSSRDLTKFIENIVKCPHCKDIMINPQSHKCGDTFCKKCMIECFAINSTKCPVCNNFILTAYSHNRYINNVIDLFISMSNEETKKRYQERIIEHKIFFDNKEKEFEEKVKKNYSFHISDIWTNSIKNDVQYGIKLCYFNGWNKNKYFSLFGLTKEYIEQADRRQLAIILFNLSIKIYLGVRYDNDQLKSIAMSIME